MGTAGNESLRPGTSVGFALTIVLGVSTAWLYVAGWTYAYTFFRHFRIPLLTLRIPREYFFLYGGFVVWHFPLWDFAIGAVLIAAAVLWPRLRIEPRMQITFCMLGLAVAFWLAFQAGRAAADRQFEADREQNYPVVYYPRVEVWPRASVMLTPGSPWDGLELGKGCYRLVLDNQDRLFLVRPFNNPAADLALVQLPWEQVEGMRAVPGDMVCP
jgi:hypothetical protein